MSQDSFSRSTRRAFLGTATVATALTVASSTGAAQRSPTGGQSDPIKVAQLKPSATAESVPAPTPTDWTKPAAMAIPREGYFKLEQGRYGPIYPRTPANYGFTIIAKLKPGREAAVREYGGTIEKAVSESTPMSSRRLGYIIFAGSFLMSARGRISCTRGSSTPISINTLKMP